MSSYSSMNSHGGLLHGRFVHRDDDLAHGPAGSGTLEGRPELPEIVSGVHRDGDLPLLGQRHQVSQVPAAGGDDESSKAEIGALRHLRILDPYGDEAPARLQDSRRPAELLVLADAVQHHVELVLAELARPAFGGVVHHLVRPQRSHPIELGRKEFAAQDSRGRGGRRGDHPRAGGLAELDGDGPHGSGTAQDEHGLPRLEIPKRAAIFVGAASVSGEEALVGGEPRQRQAGELLGVGVSRDDGHAALRDTQVLCEGSAGSSCAAGGAAQGGELAQPEVADDSLADVEIRSVTGALDDAGKVEPRGVGSVLAECRDGPLWVQELPVDRVDRGVRHPDPHLAEPWVGHGCDILEPEPVEVAPNVREVLHAPALHGGARADGGTPERGAQIGLLVARENDRGAVEAPGRVDPRAPHAHHGVEVIIVRA
mmetsp:Transcript_9020/g.31029  ORF Transcript_9020/g.31029 Transcript_9020/m.31029 type:complete len:426 (+) Transcript_9020:1992-3269(+)